MGPLDGVRILDLSRLLPGPAATWYLRGMGAIVDRVEDPAKGDFTRHVPPYIDGVAALFGSVNRGKRSLGVHLRHPEGPALVREILGNYDILVEGFKPGVMEQMGLDPAELLKDHPALVVARLSGYGQDGPWAFRPGHDINYIGLAGITAGMGHDERGPVTPVVQIGDMTGAMMAAMGICAALAGAQRSGKGQVLDVALAEGALSLVAPWVPAWTYEGRTPEPGGEMLTGSLSMYRPYRCRDGKWLTVGALEPKFQRTITALIPDTSHEGMEAGFLTRSRDEWVALLPDGCTAPALEPHELAEHPQWKARGMVKRIGSADWVRPPMSNDHGHDPPTIGEHTDAVLRDAGLDSQRIAGLRVTGVVG